MRVKQFYIQAENNTVFERFSNKMNSVKNLTDFLSLEIINVEFFFVLLPDKQWPIRLTTKQNSFKIYYIEKNEKRILADTVYFC